MTITDPLTVHRAVIAAATPEALADITLTDHDLQLVEAGLARHGGDPVLACGASADNPVADQVRALFQVAR